MNDKNRPVLSCQVAKAPFTIGKKGGKLHPKDGVFYWHVNNFTPDLEKHKVILAVQKAFNVWQQALHPLRFDSTDQWERAHIRISFARADHYDFHNGNYLLKCDTRFDGSQGVLAHAYFAEPELHLDEDENWVDCGKDQGTHLLSVLIHEIGHNLNIGHSKVKAAVMYPEYTGPKIDLHPDDISAAHFLYREDRKRYCEKNNLSFYESGKRSWIKRLLGIWNG